MVDTTDGLCVLHTTNGLCMHTTNGLCVYSVLHTTNDLYNVLSDLWSMLHVQVTCRSADPPEMEDCLDELHEVIAPLHNGI